MLALLTSCKRDDLLIQTVSSLYDGLLTNVELIIHEDATGQDNASQRVKMIHTGGIGQVKNIERFLRYENLQSKYYLHLEDDWLFENDYDWIAESVAIMENDPSIIKVMCRKDQVHPIDLSVSERYGFLNPWADPWKGHTWHGFGWNPGVTRLDLLRQFLPLPEWEQELSKKIYEAGYKVAALANGVCKHIGGGRSTHE